MEFLMILSALVILVTPKSSGSWIMGLCRGFNPSKPDLNIFSFLQKSLFLSNQSAQPFLKSEILLPMLFNKSASSTLFTYNTFDFTFSSTTTTSLKPNTVMLTSFGPTKDFSSSSSMKELLLTGVVKWGGPARGPLQKNAGWVAYFNLLRSAPHNSQSAWAKCGAGWVGPPNFKMYNFFFLHPIFSSCSLIFYILKFLITSYYTCFMKIIL